MLRQCNTSRFLGGVGESIKMDGGHQGDTPSLFLKNKKKVTKCEVINTEMKS